MGPGKMITSRNKIINIC